MNYPKLAFTDSIKKLQEQFGSRKSYEKMERKVSKEGLDEQAKHLIETRDSFYAASYGENEFPYIQHRGGPKGFLKVLDDQTLGFLDFSGNMQYITVGNISHHNRVALILVDYPNRTRLKIYAEAEIVELGTRPELEAKLQLENYKHRAERIILYHIKAYDWNCPQHITPRFTMADIEEAFASQKTYITNLEQEVERLKNELAAKADTN